MKHLNIHSTLNKGALFGSLCLPMHWNVTMHSNVQINFHFNWQKDNNDKWTVNKKYLIKHWNINDYWTINVYLLSYFSGIVLCVLKHSKWPRVKSTCLRNIAIEQCQNLNLIQRFMRYWYSRLLCCSFLSSVFH